MSDFIDQAREVEKGTFGGPWTWELGEADLLTMRTHGRVPFTLIEADHFRGSTEDADFIAAARTMLPAAVDALARVRKLHTPTMSPDHCPVCIDRNNPEFYQEHPCDTYQATEVEE